MTNRSFRAAGIAILSLALTSPWLASYGLAQATAPAEPTPSTTPAAAAAPSPVVPEAVAPTPVTPPSITPAPVTTSPAIKPPAAKPKPPTASSGVEQHITRLHDQLKITPAQAPQWDAFAQVMRDNAAHMDGVTKAQNEAPAKTAVDGMKSYLAITQAHLEDLQKLEPAFEALYTTLSDPQKKSADAMFRTRAAARPPRSAPE